MQMVEFGAENIPAEHAMHGVDGSTSSSTYPAAQSVQKADDAAAYCPAEHAVHAGTVGSTYIPAVQLVHADRSSFT
jgi:hypothetical protein